jgi:trigger factor
MEGIDKAYNKEKSKIRIQGFRPGKAPRKIIEAFYGQDFFHNDAINHCIPDAYDAAIKELGLEIVGTKSFEVEEVSSEKGAKVFAVAYVKPSVDVKKEDYTGLTYKKTEDTEATEEEINAVLNKAREQNTRILHITDRAVISGDTVTIDFEGFVDGVAFEGGKGEDYRLTIGSKSFIDTFEDQLIGKNIDEDVEVNVTFPEQYHSVELQAKPALFKVKIKDIMHTQLPDINDDFAGEVSEFDTLQEFKEDITKNIIAAKLQKHHKDIELSLVNSLIEKVPIEDLPDIMVEIQTNNLIRDFSNELKMQGMQLEQYLQYAGQDIEELKIVYRRSAEQQVRSRLILEKIAEVEGFDATPEEIDEEIDFMAAAYNVEMQQLLDSIGEEERDSLGKDIKIRKVMELIKSTAKEE